MKSRHGCLTQADSAIVGRDGMVGPYRHALVFEHRLEICEKQLVLKNASRENHRVQIPLPADPEHRLAQAVRNSQLESPRDFFHPPSAQPVMNYRLKQRPEIHFAMGERKRIGLSRGCPAGKLLHPNRGLSFKADLPRESEQRSRGVEQPPRRRGGEGSNSLAD